MDQTTRRTVDSKTASTAEILRSRQRDDLFVKNLRDNLLELFHKFGSGKLLLNIMMSEVPAKLAYFFVTTGMNNQTIGEEYTGIIQADTKALRVPSFGVGINCLFVFSILILLLQSLKKNDYLKYRIMNNIFMDLLVYFFFLGKNTRCIVRMFRRTSFD